MTKLMTRQICFELVLRLFFMLLYPALSYFHACISFIASSKNLFTHQGYHPFHIKAIIPWLILFPLSVLQHKIC